MGGCTSSDFQIQFPDEPILVPVGTTIDSLNLVGSVSCPTHGTSYLPIITEMVTGYNPQVVGSQTVSASFCDTITFTVQVMNNTPETTTPVTPTLAATPTPLPVATPSPQSTATPVNKKSIKSATFSKIGTKTYTGKAITPSLIVKGKGNYTGTKKLTFKIKKASITKASISKIKTKKYTGKAIKPTPVITYKSAKLKKNKDFTLSYKSNKKAGTASIKITGTGNFYGTKTITFQIK